MLKKVFKVSLLSLGLVAMGVPITTVQAQNLTEKLGSDPAVTKGKLSNGLTYYIRPNAKPENKVELRLVINAGSLQEDENQRGLAHFLEHMNFNGTTNFPENKMVDYLQSIGVKFGADLNAYTSFDETVYMLPIPTENPDNVEKGFQILADWAQRALLTGKDIDEERGIIIEEERAGKSAQDRMSKKFLPELLANSKYAERLPIGKVELLKTFPHSAIRQFHKDWYRPNLMAVIVVGDITKEKAEALIKKNFTSLTNPKNPRKRIAEVLPPYTGQKAMYLTDKEQNGTIFFLQFSPKRESKSVTIVDYRNDLIERMVIDMLSQRLSDLANSGSAPFAFAQADKSGYARGYESFGLILMPTGDLKPAINAAIGEVLSAAQHGFTASELEVVKRIMLSNIEKSYNERTTTNSANYLGEYQRNFLENEAYPGINKEYEYFQKFVPNITLAEVNNMLKQIHNEKDNNAFFTFVMAPEDNKIDISTDAQLKDAVVAALKQKVSAKEDVVVSNQLLTKQPIAGKIVNKTSDAQLGTATYTLSNGVLVTIKQTDFKSDEILMKAVKPGGSSNYRASDKVTVMLLPQIIESMGYGEFTPTALNKALSGTNIELLPSIGDVSSEISGSTDIKSLKSFFELVYLQLTHPRTDEELFKGFKSKMKPQLMFAKANPQFAFIDTMLYTMYDGNELRPVIMPTTAQLEALDMNRTLEIYRNEFGNADGMHFFFVGNINEAEFLPLLEQYIASLPAKGTKPMFVDNGLRLKAGNNKLYVNKGKEDKSLVIANYFGSIPYSEDMALKANLIGEILTIRVIENMREKMGSIYSGRFSGSFERDPHPQYLFSAQLPTNPQSVEPLLNATQEELDNLKKNGPTQKDLDKVRTNLIEKRKEQLKSNNYWLAKLEQLKYDNYSIERFLDMNNVLNKITVKDIQDAAKIFFDGKNSFIAVQLPEEKK